ncbi:hypothetical protein B7494_g3043 [Chlorociboria aeruginascens]|nr:hypothetical protein B7494_g3043 [Chlorociboria aeruginascens]
MTGPSTPGPSFAPPSLPGGWIAQWDGTSQRYYFVQIATGSSQWDVPTEQALGGRTPQDTPQAAEYPYGTPQQELNIITNADGSQSIKHPDGTMEPYTGERGLGTVMMNQFLGGGKKHSGQSGLVGLAEQFLGSGGSHNQNSNSHSSSGAGGLAGALIGGLLGSGKKNDHQQQNYSGSQNTQSQSGGLMSNLGGMFGGGSGHQSSGNNFGYSQHNNNPQGGYTGTAPPAAYQPAGSAQNNYGPSSPGQHSYSQNPSQSQPSPYTSPTAQHQNPPYHSPTSQQSPYGGVQHQDSYGNGHPPPSQSHPSQQYPPPSQQYPPPPNQQYPPSQYGQGPPGGYPGGPPPHSGNLEQPPHHHFQGMHNASHQGGLYSDQNQGGPPGVPMGSHPIHGQGPPGGYGGPPPDGRW